MRGSGKGALGALLLMGGGLLAAELLRDRRPGREPDPDGKDGLGDHGNDLGGLDIDRSQLFTAFNVLVDVIDTQRGEKIILSVRHIDLRQFGPNVRMTWQLDDRAISKGWSFDLTSLPGLPPGQFHSLQLLNNDTALELRNRNNDSRLHKYMVSLVHKDDPTRRLERDPSVRNGPGSGPILHALPDLRDWWRKELRAILKRLLERLDRQP